MAWVRDCTCDASGSRVGSAWPELLLRATARARHEELILALLAAVGALLGVLLGAGLLVVVCLPPSPIEPAAGLALLGRVVVVIPGPAVLGGRAALRLGEQRLRRCRRAPA